MSLFADIPLIDDETVIAAAERAVRAIPPAWPLASSVAVNPFLGQTRESLATAGARLARVAGAPVTMPRAWYREKIAAGEILDEDLTAAWAEAPAALRPADPSALNAAIARDRRRPAALPTVADLAAGVSGIDWPGLVAERIGAWAAGYFDEGQALWAAPRAHGAYAAWQAFATHDLTPEIAGLAGFAAHVFEAPQTSKEAIIRAVARLGLPPAALDTYLHQMLMTLGGWSQYARFLLWQAELGGGSDQTVMDLIAVRLIFEEALHARYGGEIAARFAEVKAAHARPVAPDTELVVDTILQAAAERAMQRRLSETLAAEPTVAAGADASAERPALQAAFCIDVRSEVFRRALETVDPRIRTLGFAGFFGLATAHRRFASDVAEFRLPVLVGPAVRSVAGGVETAPADRAARLKARAKRAWGRFRLAAVSSFAFVEAAGALYAGKLVGDTLRLSHTKSAKEPAPRLDPPLDRAAQADAAETILKAMSLTDTFARLVVIAGHGAAVVNNPHRSALACGACGGHAGDVNARLLSGLLNDATVRADLAARGIAIPDDTLFVAALHDTTSDAVTLYDEDHPSPPHAADLAQARRWFTQAGALSRGERALGLPHAGGAQGVARRGRDWAETRPEWGLAGCAAFIAAPRHRTAGRSLSGRSFLHDYDWHRDANFKVLELIMTAPVVVASWISLQYYGSTVAPEVFGAGNKLLHNVTGGIGVVEGNGGLMRAGLAWQSVHDGERYAHEPLRLSVLIEAPREAMSEILSRHPDVRALFDNGWLTLFALDADGQMAWRYAGAGTWSALPGRAAKAQGLRLVG